jgi:hypothetical protein
VQFFSTVWLRFFGNSDSLNCIYLSCTVWLNFFCHRHFYKMPFFPTVWLRFFSNSHFINCIFLSCTVAHVFSPQSFL